MWGNVPELEVRCAALDASQLMTLWTDLITTILKIWNEFIECFRHLSALQIIHVLPFLQNMMDLQDKEVLEKALLALPIWLTLYERFPTASMLHTALTESLIVLDPEIVGETIDFQTFVIKSCTSDYACHLQRLVDPLPCCKTTLLNTQPLNPLPTFSNDVLSQFEDTNVVRSGPGCIYVAWHKCRCNRIWTRVLFVLERTSLRLWYTSGVQPLRWKWGVPHAVTKKFIKSSEFLLFVYNGIVVKKLFS